MKVYDRYVVGVDLPLLARVGVTVDDFKVASTQVDSMAIQAGAQALAATINRSINVRKAYLAHSGEVACCLVHHILNTDLGKDRVPSIFNPTGYDQADHDRRVEFLREAGGSLLISTVDPSELGFLVRFEGSRKARTCCKGEGAQCNGHDDGSPCCGGTCNPEDDVPAVRILSGWTEAQVWAAVHRFAVPFPKSYL